jgi:hypothetical protein
MNIIHEYGSHSSLSATEVPVFRQFENTITKMWQLEHNRSMHNHNRWSAINGEFS